MCVVVVWCVGGWFCLLVVWFGGGCMMWFSLFSFFVVWCECIVCWFMCFLLILLVLVLNWLLLLWLDVL